MTQVRRAWAVHDGMGNMIELRIDFTDKLADFHIGIPLAGNPSELAQALLNAGHALAIELHHKTSAP